MAANDPIADTDGLCHQLVMGLFSIVCDYAGGTFVSQVQATDETEALAKWAEVLPAERPLGNASEKIASAALAACRELAALDGMIGVWCWTETVDDALALVNIIHTAE